MHTHKSNYVYVWYSSFLTLKRHMCAFTRAPQELRLNWCVHACTRQIDDVWTRMECSSRVKHSAVTRYSMVPCVQYSLDASVRHHNISSGWYLLHNHASKTRYTFSSTPVAASTVMSSVNKAHNVENSYGIVSLTIQITWVNWRYLVFDPKY